MITPSAAQSNPYAVRVTFRCSPPITLELRVSASDPDSVVEIVRANRPYIEMCVEMTHECDVHGYPMQFTTIQSLR